MTDEMREGDESLDALRRAFEALPAPPPVRELGSEDDDTRRVVAWMAAAWSAQAPATSAPPATLRPAALRPTALPRRAEFAWRPLAAAAVVLVLLGGSLLVAHVTRGRVASQPAPPVAQTPAAPSRPGIVAAADDHLELRSGPVRMLLFLQPPPASREEPR
jgi:hypothetical protein